MKTWLNKLVKDGTLPLAGVYVEKNDKDEGVLKLDDPVHKYLGPKWEKKNLKVGDDLKPCKNDITISMLLSHTSGLCYGHFPDRCLAEKLYSESSAKHSNGFLENSHSIVDRIVELPLSFQPGEHWRYSYATDVVGVVLEKVSNKSLGELLKVKVFDPLKMKDTSFLVPNDKLDNLSHMFQENGEKCFKDISMSTLAAGRNRQDRVDLNNSGGGGLVSTVHDYKLFARCLLKRKMLSKELYRQMLTNHIAGNRTMNEAGLGNFTFPLVMPPLDAGFGLGFRVTGESKSEEELSNPGSFGWIGYGGTAFWVDPADNSFCIFITQVIAPSTGPRVWEELQRVVYT